MKERETYPGKTYAVRSADGCIITDANGDIIKECAAGQDYFVADVARVFVSDDNAKVQQVFNLAPQQKLTLLGVLGGNAGGAGELPAGWTRLEYLEGTGKQYIDTLIVGNSSYRIEATFQPTRQTITANTVNLFGCCEKYASKQHSFVAIYDNTNERATVFHRMDTNTSWDTVSVTYEKPCYFSITRGTAIIGETVKTVATTQFDHVVSMAFFSVKDATTFGTPCSGRIFSCAIYDGDGNVVFEGIPALDKTGAPSVYDKRSKKAFYNKGTGDFIYPTSTTTYALRRGLPDWGKLTEHGLRRLYHAPADWDGELIDYALENGYKPIVEPERPEDGYWTPQWRETEDEIILDWIETEEPKDEFLTPTE